MARAKVQEQKDQCVSFGMARFVRVTPRKARLIADLIRGKSVLDARNILEFTNRPSAVPHMKKLLHAVVASAEKTHRGKTDELIVERVNVDAGPIMRRIQPRAMGRAFRILKRTCHISIGLTEG